MACESEMAEVSKALAAVITWQQQGPALMATLNTKCSLLWNCLQGAAGAESSVDKIAAIAATKWQVAEAKATIDNAAKSAGMDLATVQSLLLAIKALP